MFRRQYLVTYDHGDYLYYAVRIRARSPEHAKRIAKKQYGDIIVHWVDED